MLKLLLVGYGTMAKALHTAWQWDYSITKVSPGDSECYGRPEDLPPSYKPQIVVFAVKPDVLTDILLDYRHLTMDAICISVAAGVTTTTLNSIISRVWVRCMPNIAASVQSSVNGLIAGPGLTSTFKETVNDLFKKTGTSVWLTNEAEFDGLTAISGSGPAYVFLLCEMMAKASIELGIDKDVSETLARATIIGAAHMLDHYERIPAAELRKSVTSPNGTTQAALDVLMKDGDYNLEMLIKEAMHAAAKRSLELSAPPKAKKVEKEDSQNNNDS